MDNKTKFSLGILFTMGIYFILTFPMFLAFFTMDIDTGEYSGIVYPFWLCIVISIISGILGTFLSRYIINKYKL